MNNVIKFPQLETDRLILRELAYEDIDTVFPHFSNEEITRYQDEYPAKNTDDIKEIIDWGKGLLEHGMGILWGIFSRGEGSFLGQVNYVARPDHNFTQNVHRAEIGYDLSPQYWGKGYVSEALRCAIPHIFTHTKIDRLEAIIKPENTRSHQVVLRLGFKKEGVLRQYVVWEGDNWDMVLYSLLKGEWEVKA